MHLYRLGFPVLLLMSLATACYGQLSADQKKSDFRQLADRFAKQYAPYEWKKTALKVDILQLGPWLERAAATKDDLEYYDLCVEYVSSLVDAHDYYQLPSTFSATLGFTVDLYDGKALIDSIDGTLLPPPEFDAKVGDELISVDGKTVEEWAKALGRYAFGGNAISNKRDAVGLIVSRSQTTNPYAHKIGEKAEVVWKNAVGEVKTFALPWRKRGTPVEQIAAPRPVTMAASVNRGLDDNDPEAYREYLERKANLRADTRGRSLVRGFGAKDPIYQLPEGFQATVGLSRFDTVYGGVIPFEGKRVGYLRLARFAGGSATRQIQTALTSFKETTDVLVIDVTRNPGGSACMIDEMAAELMTDRWKAQGAEQMVTWRDILSLQASIDFARLLGDTVSLAMLEFDLAAYERAFREGKTRTEPLPFCAPTMERPAALGADNTPRAYAKPVLVLIDEFSTSAAEHLAALLQDNGRAKLFGKRTVGAGGAVIAVAGGPYAEGRTTLTWTLTNRSKAVATSDYPEAPYIENIGVRPDIEYEFNTEENLRNQGKPFVEAFLKAAIGLIP